MFLLVSEGSSENCERCAQIEELLHLVAGLWDEVDRLGSIQESKKGVDWWNHTVFSGTEMLARHNP